MPGTGRSGQRNGGHGRPPGQRIGEKLGFVTEVRRDMSRNGQCFVVDRTIVAVIVDGATFDLDAEPWLVRALGKRVRLIFEIDE